MTSDTNHRHKSTTRGLNLPHNERAQLPHHCGQLGKLSRQHGRKVLHRVLVPLADPSEDVLGLPGPPDLAPDKGHHAQVIKDPLCPVVEVIHRQEGR